MLPHFYESIPRRASTISIRVIAQFPYSRSTLVSQKRRRSSEWCFLMKFATRKSSNALASTKSWSLVTQERKQLALLKSSETWPLPKTSSSFSWKKTVSQRRSLCLKYRSVTQKICVMCFRKDLESIMQVWANATGKWLKTCLLRDTCKSCAQLQP